MNTLGGHQGSTALGFDLPLGSKVLNINNALICFGSYCIGLPTTGASIILPFESLYTAPNDCCLGEPSVEKNRGI
ncbi:hypothetical protein TGAM01_v202169 [Trichoderma gamsii]|uniref:Uncharacterized protein n=1 Tax=Trichoderma gamsii TaxID=398673 RepID=A0A2P4ZXS5_9HYPO|nr:hypothetical protein TGAM01_v202169 [Trichoderma gamsii]PON29061.1 hypothetical protein TGAM01_v202169 [Trichoderma gamsii]